MDLDTLKSEWKSWEENPKQEEQLRKMAERGNFKFLKHIKRRLLIESAALFLLLIIYFDWFDGHLKPVWVNILLACSLVLLVGHDLMVYRSINLHLQGINLKQALQKLLIDLRFQSRVATGLIGVFYVALLAFLTINITFTQTKLLMFVALVLICGIALWLTARWWQKRIHSLKQCISDLEEK